MENSQLSNILKAVFLKVEWDMASCHCYSVILKVNFRKCSTVFMNVVI